MTEECGPYARRPEQRQEAGVQHIRDVLRQFVDEQGWGRRLLPEANGENLAQRSNGRRRDG